MRTLRALAFSTLLVFGTTASLQAGDVTVKGVHICCGACVKGANDALAGIEGLSDINPDKATKMITFKAADEKAAKTAIEKLAAAGFHGTATLDTKELAFPESGVKKGDKANTVVITGVHLCCGNCVAGVKKALKDREDVKDPQIDSKARTVTITGTDIDIAAVIAALNQAGFHGTIKSEKK